MGVYVIEGEERLQQPLVQSRWSGLGTCNASPAPVYKQSMSKSRSKSKSKSMSMSNLFVSVGLAVLLVIW